MRGIALIDADSQREAFCDADYNLPIVFREQVENFVDCYLLYRVVALGGDAPAFLPPGSLDSLGLALEEAIEDSMRMIDKFAPESRNNDSDDHIERDFGAFLRRAKPPDVSRYSRALISSILYLHQNRDAMAMSYESDGLDGQRGDRGRIVSFAALEQAQNAYLEAQRKQKQEDWAIQLRDAAARVQDSVVQSTSGNDIQLDMNIRADKAAVRSVIIGLREQYDRDLAELGLPPSTDEEFSAMLLRAAPSLAKELDLLAGDPITGPPKPAILSTITASTDREESNLASRASGKASNTEVVPENDSLIRESNLPTGTAHDPSPHPEGTSKQAGDASDISIGQLSDVETESAESLYDTIYSSQLSDEPLMVSKYFKRQVKEFTQPKKDEQPRSLAEYISFVSQNRSPVLEETILPIRFLREATHSVMCAFLLCNSTLFRELRVLSGAFFLQDGPLARGLVDAESRSWLQGGLEVDAPPANDRVLLPGAREEPLTRLGEVLQERLDSYFGSCWRDSLPPCTRQRALAPPSFISVRAPGGAQADMRGLLWPGARPLPIHEVLRPCDICNLILSARNIWGDGGAEQRVGDSIAELTAGISGPTRGALDLPGTNPISDTLTPAQLAQLSRLRLSFSLACRGSPGPTAALFYAPYLPLYTAAFHWIFALVCAQNDLVGLWAAVVHRAEHRLNAGHDHRVRRIMVARERVAGALSSLVRMIQLRLGVACELEEQRLRAVLESGQNVFDATREFTRGLLDMLGAALLTPRYGQLRAAIIRLVGESSKFCQLSHSYLELPSLYEMGSPDGPAGLQAAQVARMTREQLEDEASSTFSLVYESTLSLQDALDGYFQVLQVVAEAAVGDDKDLALLL